MQVRKKNSVVHEEPEGDMTTVPQILGILLGLAFVMYIFACGFWHGVLMHIWDFLLM